MDPAAIESLIAWRVTDALAEYEAHRKESSGPENGNFRSNNGGNPRPCLYHDFMKFKPEPYYGDGGVIELALWFDKMESAFEASLCTADCKVGFATSTFRDTALSWWGIHVKTRGLVAANTLPWERLKILMVEEYCPRSVRQNLEHELGNLTMKGSDIKAYTKRFNNLATLCPEMVTPEHKKIERYVRGLTSQIQEILTAYRPTTFESVKSIVESFVNQSIHQGAMVRKADSPRGGENKRKVWEEFEEGSQQFPNKKQENTKVTPTPQKCYAGSLPKCDKCDYHHNGKCRELLCKNCNRKGHTTRFCKKPIQRRNLGNNAGAGRACFGCGGLGHFKKKCPGRSIGMESMEAIRDPS